MQKRARTTAALTSPAGAATLAALASGASPEGEADDWTLRYGALDSVGRVTTEIEVRWQDAEGKQHEQTIKIKAEFERDSDGPMTGDEQREHSRVSSTMRWMSRVTRSMARESRP